MTAHSEYLSRELARIEDLLHAETDKLQPLVQPLTRHVLAAGGKRLRPLLTILYARALGHGGDDVYPLACSLEFLHSATLLHDDILDGSSLRRGKPTAHVIFSRGETILAGDVLLALANRMVADYGRPRLVSVLSDAVMRTVVGEIEEIMSGGEGDLSLDRYMEIITGKTAYLIQAAGQAGAILAGADEEQVTAAGEFGLNMGIAFQLVDDALDYASPPEVSGKPRGADLREGKLTMPLLLLAETRPDKERRALLERVAERALGEEEIEAVVGDVLEGGYDAKTRDFAAGYAEKARDALGLLPECTERAILEQSLDLVLTREK
ncbi:polyprenyl synthetase family protein [Desulfohalovibrio reitneri]|uniref:polyprenyl synthetase family protein n=1 Tax=Desulfohalovibrio reitneri TaxID=1307759 RepID=UPI0004A6F578|nr:polyprenyl synthetase family protein [Desulfohalovibrio reitneri]